MTIKYNDQWPPQPEKREGMIFARREVLRKTKPIIIEAFPRYKTDLKRAIVEDHRDDLELCLEETQDDVRLALKHGILSPKKGTFYRMPSIEESLHVLNDRLEESDRIVIAQSVTREFLQRAFDRYTHSKVEGEVGESDESGEGEEDEAEMTFDIGLPPPDQRPWENHDYEQYEEDEERRQRHAEFLEVIEVQTNIREIYEALLAGHLSEYVLGNVSSSNS